MEKLLLLYKIELQHGYVIKWAMSLSDNIPVNAWVSLG